MYTNGGEFADCFGDMSVNDALTVVGREHSVALSPPLEIGQRELATWNATQQDYPRNLCVPQLVARQTGATPGAVALVAGAQLNNGITITFLPTALAESVMALEWPPETTLRLLLTGADTLHHYPSPTLPFTAINNYGPTETTFGQVPPTTHAPMPPPIGRPIANTQIYILDEQLRQVPSGLPGEIYIGGAGLSRGYLNRPELTAEKFIPHPFSNKPGARLYKTGELARFPPDGQIAFLGRTDQQIKIRGYRVEPDEIVSMLELVINRQPSMSLRIADSSARPSIGAAP